MSYKLFIELNSRQPIDKEELTDSIINEIGGPLKSLVINKNNPSKDKILHEIDTLIQKNKELKKKITGSNAKSKYNYIISELKGLFEFVEEL